MKKYLCLSSAAVVIGALRVEMLKVKNYASFWNWNAHPRYLLLYLVIHVLNFVHMITSSLTTMTPAGK